MKTEHVIAANGYSNLYWGWGKPQIPPLYYLLIIFLTIINNISFFFQVLKTTICITGKPESILIDINLNRQKILNSL